MSKWIPSDEVPEGEGRCYDVDGEHVAVVHMGSQWYAMAGRCPQAEAARQKTALQDILDNCPNRDWRFDPAEGACSFKPEVVQALSPIPSQSRFWEAGGAEEEVELVDPAQLNPRGH